MGADTLGRCNNSLFPLKDARHISAKHCFIALVLQYPDFAAKKCADTLCAHPPPVPHGIPTPGRFPLVACILME